MRSYYLEAKGRGTGNGWVDGCMKEGLKDVLMDGEVKEGSKEECWTKSWKVGADYTRNETG